MKVKEILETVDGKLICGSSEGDISVAFGSDLMSDVLAFCSHDVILITGLVNLQTIRTAEMAGITHILFVRSKKVSPAMLELAEENEMTLLESHYSMFKSCGLLYMGGIKGCF